MRQKAKSQPDNSSTLLRAKPKFTKRLTPPRESEEDRRESGRMFSRKRECVFAAMPPKTLREGRGISSPIPRFLSSPVHFLPRFRKVLEPHTDGFLRLQICISYRADRPSARYENSRTADPCDRHFLRFWLRPKGIHALVRCVHGLDVVGPADHRDHCGR